MMRMRLLLTSVGAKLFVVISGTVVLLSVLLGLISFQVSKDIIRNEVGTASSRAVGQAADKLDFLFAQYESMSRQLAVDQTVRQDLAAVSSSELGNYEKNQAAERLRKKLDALVSSDSRLLGARLVPPELVDSLSYKSAGINSLRKDAAVEERMQLIWEADGEPVWFPAIKAGFFQNSTVPAITMGRFMKNLQQPEVRFVLLLEIRQSALGEALTGITVGHSGTIRIIAEDNRIVHAENEALLEADSFIRPEAAEEETEGNGYFVAEDEAGIGQLVAYKKLDTTGWTMLGYAPEQEFTAPAVRLLYITAAVVLAAVCMSMLIGLYLVRKIGRPLSDLSKLMEKGARGNLQIRAAGGGRDEIGRLGASFNDMAAQLSTLVGQISVSAEEVMGTAGEAAGASLNTAQLAREIAAVTQEIAAGASSLALEADHGKQAVEATGQTMGQVAASTVRMNESVQRVMGISREGRSYMETLLGKTDAAARITAHIHDHSARLEQSAKSIRLILEPMAAMTKQTHILSLNASIEAARAGSAGKGFMVIAEEIRQLAAKSAASLETVSSITGGIEADIDATRGLLLEAEPLYKEQLQSVRESAAFFADVGLEMDKLVLHIEEASRFVRNMEAAQEVLGRAIDNVSVVVEETCLATHQVAEMSAEQQGVSESLVTVSHNMEQLAEVLNGTLVHFRTDEAQV